MSNFEDAVRQLAKIKVYIAAPVQERERAHRIKNVLELNGVIVTARWITLENFEKKDKEPAYLAMWAQYDLDDVDECDILLALSDEKFRNVGSGGRHVELGYAIARGKKVIVMGERTNIFHWHPSIVHLESSDFVKAVQKLAGV